MHDTRHDGMSATSCLHDLYFYFYRIMTYFNSLKIVTELRCEKGRKEEKNIIRNKFKNMYKAGSEFKDEMW